MTPRLRPGRHSQIKNTFEGNASVRIATRPEAIVATVVSKLTAMSCRKVHTSDATHRAAHVVLDVCSMSSFGFCLYSKIPLANFLNLALSSLNESPTFLSCMLTRSISLPTGTVISRVVFTPSSMTFTLRVSSLHAHDAVLKAVGTLAQILFITGRDEDREDMIEEATDKLRNYIRLLDELKGMGALVECNEQ
jgi:hypothetical protein